MTDSRAVGGEEISVRPFSSVQDYEKVVDYFIKADDAFLNSMGVERKNLPEREKWLQRLVYDLGVADNKKQSFFIGWVYGDQLVGHSNINTIKFGLEANMHLHLWRSEIRRVGLGTQLVKKSVDIYFQRFQLQKLICEPWAKNRAPNRVLQKAGFTLVRTYKTVPSPLNSEIVVNRYELVRPEGNTNHD